MDQKWKLAIRMQIVSETVHVCLACYAIFWFTDREDTMGEKSAHQYCKRLQHVLEHAGWAAP